MDALHKMLSLFRLVGCVYHCLLVCSNMSVIWVYAVVFPIYSGYLLPLQLVSFDLACYGK